ncbi:glycoside hydrolase family 65 protein [Salipaludibacillus aurantiacus]|uniref:Alpha,alpha-trehalose phosphorylase n=1 Tax=Salipaludibacillus aurantiacus TaxID=1601833 RepID=A0A1H9WJ96_9BACI|nr:glycosyl hydrolase family 65 protein [Salipaludibacillus aurantiacus]SES33950.1 alpha,alpha-trehalose phosphorylase [Salipaludibacillus aurantiacus]
MSWKIQDNHMNQEQLLVNESLFALGNGYLGVRGNFEEGYTEDMTSIRGTYINAYHDETAMEYGEKLHGFPDTQQKLVNIIDSQTIYIYVDGERFTMFEGDILSYTRTLHLNKGYSEREIHWKSPSGKEVKFRFQRLVSFSRKELFAQKVTIEAVSETNEIVITSAVNGDISNFVDPSDPRVASGHAKRLRVVEAEAGETGPTVLNETYETKLRVCCASNSVINSGDYNYNVVENGSSIEEIFRFTPASSVSFTRFNIFTDTYRHGEDLKHAAWHVQNELKSSTFEDLITEQTDYLNAFWSKADIEIEGDDSLQQGIRFNLYQLLQSAGKDSVSNISAKGLSGEGYEGHYFWDTEIYMFPVFLMTQPEIAKQLLLHRFSLLDDAKSRAMEVGHRQGALFPWRTITGSECSGFFPAGTAQYHISADIAYSFVQYYLVTKDVSFLRDYGAEVLAETARLWIDTGHEKDGKFLIDDVTGPDEYTCIVNNNFYTNVMAKNNLKWAVKSLELIKEADQQAFEKLAGKLNVSEAEIREWEQAAEKMYLPYDESLGIHAQDDTFLNKQVWNLEQTPAEKFPLLLHYHPLTLYRYQVCKQADTVLAHFLLEDEADLETIRRSYNYYEKVTTHDSSLSYCVFSIMAAKLGYDDKAYNYFIETARLDLDNTHKNTKDGLHMANMGGTWLALVYGFAGLRVKEDSLLFNPRLPLQWDKLKFTIQYMGRTLQVGLHKGKTVYTLNEGKELVISHKGEKVTVSKEAPVELNS